MNIQKGLLLLFLASLIISCEEPTDNDNNEPGIKTGKVTFFNESSYRVKVHRDSFSGIVLSELFAGESKGIDVRISDNPGYGTTFSIEYLYRITEGFDTENGEVIASGLDFDVQINRVIEEGKSYTIQIPQPQNIEFRTAFIKLLNASDLPCELRYYGNTLPLNNGNLTVVPGKTGVYKLDGIPAEGKLYQNYTVVSTFALTTIPDFTAENGHIYSFTYNGSAVAKTGEQTIIFK